MWRLLFISRSRTSCIRALSLVSLSAFLVFLASGIITSGFHAFCDSFVINRYFDRVTPLSQMGVQTTCGQALAWAVDVIMTQAKRIYILIVKVKKLFSFFWSWCFLKEIENMFSAYRVIIETLLKVWETSKKPWKHSPASRVSTTFLILVFL